MNKNKIPEEHQNRLTELACFLRELRFAEGMTQQEVCEELNLHKNTLIRVENGYDMNVTTLFEIADFYDIPIGEIFS